MRPKVAVNIMRCQIPTEVISELNQHIEDVIIPIVIANIILVWIVNKNINITNKNITNKNASVADPLNLL